MDAPDDDEVSAGSEEEASSSSSEDEYQKIEEEDEAGPESKQEEASDEENGPDKEEKAQSKWRAWRFSQKRSVSKVHCDVEDDEATDCRDARILEEEIEEEQDRLVRYIQRAFRRRRARRMVKELILSNYIKEIDHKDSGFLYRNKRTNETQKKKPLALGTDDLPDPRVYQAPTGYDGLKDDESIPSQFALIVHCTNFSDPKLHNLPKCIENDHDAICTRLVNPYMARFREADCLFAKRNVTKQMVLSHLDTLTKLIARAAKTKKRPDIVLLIVLCTHIAQITKGRNSGTYICFTDTSLSAGQENALPLKQFHKILERLECDQKTIVLDCAHTRRPVDTLLRTTLLYPPSNLYAAMAHRGRCHVIGACKLGPDPLLAGLKKVMPGTAGYTENDSSSCTGQAGHCQRQATKAHRWTNKKFLSLTPRARLTLLQKKTIRVDPVYSLKMRLEERDNKYVVLDEIDLVSQCPRRAVRFARDKAIAARAWALQRSSKRQGDSTSNEKTRLAQYQVSLYGEQHSVFGAALIHAFEGAATQGERLVTQKLLDAVNSKMNEEQRAQAETHCVNDSRVMTVGSAPSVPPAPSPPCALPGGVQDRSVLLGWEDPEFSGARPLQYELQYQGTAKYDSNKWFPVAEFAHIDTTTFLAPHLVPGVAIRFRVRARNFGGWGDWSQPSELILPSKRSHETYATTLHRAARRGVPCLLDFMQNMANISQAQTLGFKQLAASATKNRGFKRPAVAARCANVVLRAMHTYKNDAEIQATGCLVLGWCFYNHTGVANDMAAARDSIEAACDNFPHNVAVIGNAKWALSHLPESSTETLTERDAPLHSGKGIEKTKKFSIVQRDDDDQGSVGSSSSAHHRRVRYAMMSTG